MSNLTKRKRKLTRARMFKIIQDTGTSLRNRIDKDLMTVFSNGFSTESTGSEDVETPIKGQRKL